MDRLPTRSHMGPHLHIHGDASVTSPDLSVSEQTDPEKTSSLPRERPCNKVAQLDTRQPGLGTAVRYPLPVPHLGLLPFPAILGGREVSNSVTLAQLHTIRHYPPLAAGTSPQPIMQISCRDQKHGLTLWSCCHMHCVLGT